METEQILSYFLNNWEKVKQLALSRGLSRGFYPLVLMEYGDHRLIDTSLQAVEAEFDQLITANITNPSIYTFMGLILKEDPDCFNEDGRSIVDVTYLDRERVSQLQCVRLKQGNLKRYEAISIPCAPLDCPSGELQKVYNELESLLG